MNVHQQFEADDSQSSDLLSSLPSILWHRRWLIVIPFVLCAIAGAAAAFLLPRTYQSKATMVVESQNLPAEMGQGTTGELIDRRIARIRQQLLSRPDLVQIIQANDLYRASRRAEPLSAMVERMRGATTLQAVDARVNSGRGSIAFELSFNYPEPVPAQLVAQTFVDKLLKLDQSSSQSQADDNVRFLEGQQETLQEQVGALEGEINRITGQNGVALANAGGSAIMMSGGSGYETQIASIQRDNAQLAAQLGNGQNPAVAQAEAQLAAVKAVYADDHPDVKLAESRLAAARQAANAMGANRGEQAIRAQIATNNNLIQQITQARSAEQGRAAQLLAAQSRGPVIAQQVRQLQARADALRANLSRVNSSLINAQSLSKLATEQRGERLMLVDPPVTPDEPTSPNRKMLIAGGIAGGGALGVGLALLVELLMRPIRSVNALTRLVGSPPLGVVPVMRMPRRRGDRTGGRIGRILSWPFRAIAWPFRMLAWPFRKLGARRRAAA